MATTPFDLTGRTALVTGANTGIGQGIAIALAQAGADIAAVGRSPADETAEQVRALGRRCELVDLSDYRRLVHVGIDDAIKRELGALVAEFRIGCLDKVTGNLRLKILCT